MGKNEKQCRSCLIAGGFSLLFSAAILFGARLDSVENVDVKDATLWLQLGAFTVIFTGMVLLLWRLMDGLRGRGISRIGKAVNKITDVFNVTDEQADIAAFLFLILCWLPVFMAVYPGFFVYDAQDEYIQVATRTFSTHHPLVHVLLLGGMICGVHKLTDSYNLGIACYMVFQMVLAAGVFTFLFPTFAKKDFPRAAADRPCLAGGVSHSGNVYPVLCKGCAVYAGSAAASGVSSGDGRGEGVF